MKRGENEAYLLRRLARDRPDILEAYGKGEYPSAKAAARAAGIPLGSPSVRLSPDPRKAADTLRQRFDAAYLEALREALGKAT